MDAFTVLRTETLEVASRIADEDFEIEYHLGAYLGIYPEDVESDEEIDPRTFDYPAELPGFVVEALQNLYD